MICLIMGGCAVALAVCIAVLVVMSVGTEVRGMDPEMKEWWGQGR
mgnify:CR=1 FL=1